MEEMNLFEQFENEEGAKENDIMNESREKESEQTIVKEEIVKEEVVVEKEVVMNTESKNIEQGEKKNMEKTEVFQEEVKEKTKELTEDTNKEKENDIMNSGKEIMDIEVESERIGIQDDYRNPLTMKYKSVKMVSIVLKATKDYETEIPDYNPLVHIDIKSRAISDELYNLLEQNNMLYDNYKVKLGNKVKLCDTFAPLLEVQQENNFPLRVTQKYMTTYLKHNKKQKMFRVYASEKNKEGEEYFCAVNEKIPTPTKNFKKDDGTFHDNVYIFNPKGEDIVRKYSLDSSYITPGSLKGYRSIWLPFNNEIDIIEMNNRLNCGAREQREATRKYYGVDKIRLESLAKECARDSLGLAPSKNIGEVRSFCLIGGTFTNDNLADGLSFVNGDFWFDAVNKYRTSIGQKELLKENILGMGIQARPATCKSMFYSIPNEGIKHLIKQNLKGKETATIIVDEMSIEEQMEFNTLFVKIEGKKSIYANKVLYVYKSREDMKRGVDILTDLNAMKDCFNLKYPWPFRVLSINQYFTPNETVYTSSQLIQDMYDIDTELTKKYFLELVEDFGNKFIECLSSNNFTAIDNLIEDKFDPSNALTNKKVNIRSELFRTMPLFMLKNMPHVAYKELSTRLKGIVRNLNCWRVKIPGSMFAVKPDLAWLFFGIKALNVDAKNDKVEMLVPGLKRCLSKGQSEMVAIRYPNGGANERVIVTPISISKYLKRVTNLLVAQGMTKYEAKKLMRDSGFLKAILNMKKGMAMVPASASIMILLGGMDFDKDTIVIFFPEWVVTIFKKNKPIVVNVKDKDNYKNNGKIPQYVNNNKDFALQYMYNLYGMNTATVGGVISNANNARKTLNIIKDIKMLLGNENKKDIENTIGTNFNRLYGQLITILNTVFCQEYYTGDMYLREELFTTKIIFTNDAEIAFANKSAGIDFNSKPRLDHELNFKRDEEGFLFLDMSPTEISDWTIVIKNYDFSKSNLDDLEKIFTALTFQGRTNSELTIDSTKSFVELNIAFVNQLNKIKFASGLKTATTDKGKECLYFIDVDVEKNGVEFLDNSAEMYSKYFRTIPLNKFSHLDGIAIPDNSKLERDLYKKFETKEYIDDRQAFIIRDAVLSLVNKVNGFLSELEFSRNTLFDIASLVRCRSKQLYNGEIGLAHIYDSLNILFRDVNKVYAKEQVDCIKNTKSDNLNSHSYFSEEANLKADLMIANSERIDAIKSHIFRKFNGCNKIEVAAQLLMGLKRSIELKNEKTDLNNEKYPEHARKKTVMEIKSNFFNLFEDILVEFINFVVKNKLDVNVPKTTKEIIPLLENIPVLDVQDHKRVAITEKLFEEEAINLVKSLSDGDIICLRNDHFFLKKTGFKSYEKVEAITEDYQGFHGRMVTFSRQILVKVNENGVDTYKAIAKQRFSTVPYDNWGMATANRKFFNTVHGKLSDAYIVEGGNKAFYVIIILSDVKDVEREVIRNGEIVKVPGIPLKAEEKIKEISNFENYTSNNENNNLSQYAAQEKDESF